MGTLEFMPPEVLRGHSKATRAADVYAWAVTANALATRLLPPFADCDKPSPACHTVLEFGYGRQELVAAVAGEGLRPRLARKSLPNSRRLSSFSSSSSSASSLSLIPPPARFLSLIERCWHADPKQRPSAAEVARECRRIEEEVRREEEEQEERGLKEEAASNGTKEKSQLRADDGSAAAALLNTVALDSCDDDEDESEGGRPWPAPGWALSEEEKEKAEKDEKERRNPSSSSPSPSYLPSVTAAAFETIGRREAMEDAVLACSPLYPLPPEAESMSKGQKPAHLFAVFDGHRGAGAALYAALSLRRHLRSVWEGSKSPEEALSRAFVRLDARWRRREAAALARAEEASSSNCGGDDGNGSNNGCNGDFDLQRRQKRHCGAAATAALVWGDSLTVANVGDCRGLLAVLNDDDDEGEEGGGEVEEVEGEANGDGKRRNETQTQTPKKRFTPSWRALRLTRDHSADDPSERARVQSEGGILLPPPSNGGRNNGNQKKGWRLGPVGLAVTRALGDADVPGCSAIPFVSRHKLTSSCVALILMTDGVTEAMEARRGDATSFELEAKRRRKKKEEKKEKDGGGNDDEMKSGGEKVPPPLSPSELVDEEIAALVADTVKEAGMAARRLVVEAVEHRQGRDNAAALVAYLSPVESLERVF